MQNTGYFTDLLILFLIVIALIIIYLYTRHYRRPSKGKNNYLEALEFLADNDYKRAIQKFKETVKENTENISAYLRLGNLLRERGFAKNALKIHKDLTLRSGLKPDIQIKVQHSLMLDYEAMGDMEHAIDMANKILSKDSAYSREVSNRLLNYLEKKQDWEAAYDASKTNMKQLSNPQKKRMALYLVFEGLDLMKEDKGRDARIKFKEALKIDAQCTPAYYHLGQSYYLEDRLEDAVREWQSLCQHIPEHAYIAFDALERAWFELGKFTEAEKLYNDMLTTNSENIQAALALAEIYSKKGEYDRALELLDRFESMRPNDPQIISYKIQLLHNKNQYKTASSVALDYFQKQNILISKNYVCQECHYTSEEPLWICPRCKSIDTFKI